MECMGNYEFIISHIWEMMGMYGKLRVHNFSYMGFYDNYEKLYKEKEI